MAERDLPPSGFDRFEWIVHALPGSLLVFDPQARLLAVSEPARRCLADLPGVSLASPTGDGPPVWTLRLVDADTQRRLERLVRSVGAGRGPAGPDGRPAPSRAMALLAPAGRIHLSVRFGRLRVPGPQAVTAVVGTLVDHTAVPDVDPGLLRQLYDLEDAPARVAAACLRADTLPEIARMLSMSTSAAKAHLGTVYARTGCRRRAQLIRLLLRLQEAHPGARAR